MRHILEENYCQQLHSIETMLCQQNIYFYSKLGECDLHIDIQIHVYATWIYYSHVFKNYAIDILICFSFTDLQNTFVWFSFLSLLDHETCIFILPQPFLQRRQPAYFSFQFWVPCCLLNKLGHCVWPCRWCSSAHMSF